MLAEDFASDDYVVLLESSLALLKADKSAFTDEFYNNLFAQSPQLKPLFAHTAIEKQGEKLFAALVLLVENMRHPQELERILKPLGARHKGYGIIPQHYIVLQSALLETLGRHLADNWTSDVAQAWQQTLQHVSNTMLQGAGDVMPDDGGGTNGQKYTKADRAVADKSQLLRDTQFGIVEKSFEKITRKQKEFVETFYNTLFQQSPQLQPLFADTGSARMGTKLFGALTLMVENIRQPDELKKILIPLGERHKSYGTIPEHYILLESALLSSFSRLLEEDWKPEVEQAWSDAIRAVAKIMQSAPGSVEDESPRLQAVMPKKNKIDGAAQSDSATEATSKRIKAQYLESLKKRRTVNTDQYITWFFTAPFWLLCVAAAAFIVLLIPLGERFPIVQNLMDIIEPLSLLLALLLFVREGPDRKKQFHYQAWGVVDAAKGIKKSHARILALQDLCDDGVPLQGLELEAAQLSNIELNRAEMADANLTGAQLGNASLQHIDLYHAVLERANCTSVDLSHASMGFANLNKANFSSADLSNSNLMFADLRGGNFSGADLSNAKLNGAQFDEAYLSGANLTGAEVNLDDLETAYLVGTVMPDGTTHA